MTDELIMKERLEGLQRVLDAGHKELAGHLIRCMIDEIDLKVEKFESEMQEEFEFYGS